MRYKIVIVILLVAAVGAALALKHGPEAPVEPASAPEAAASKPLPKLLDLGADRCIPCKQMAPILEEMKVQYAGHLEVVFIDVWKNRGEAEKYGIRSIPTRIFFDAEGNEMFRHQGFYSKEDMLAKWKELGIDLPAPATVQK